MTFGLRCRDFTGTLAGSVSVPVEVGVAEEEQEEEEGRVGLELSSNDMTVKSLSGMVPRGLES